MLDGPLPADETGRAGGRPYVTRPRTWAVASPALVRGSRLRWRHPRAPCSSPAGRARPSLRPRPRRLRRTRCDRTARRPCRAPPRTRRCRALRRAAARPGLAADPAARPARGRSADVKPLALAARPRRRAPARLRSRGQSQDPGGALATILAADPRAASRPSAPQARCTGGSTAGSVPTTPRPRRSAAPLARRPQRAARGGRARRDAPPGSDRGGGAWMPVRGVEHRCRRASARRACSPTAAPTASTAPSPARRGRTGGRRSRGPPDRRRGADPRSRRALAVSRLGLELAVVLLHNDGGGVFRFLRVAGEGEELVERVATPPGWTRPDRRAVRLRLRGRRGRRGLPRRARPRAPGGPPATSPSDRPRGERRAAPGGVGRGRDSRSEPVNRTV